MKKVRNLYVLETSDLKIIETISLLNKDSYYPLAEGVYKILVGLDDEESIKFSELPTYKTLISYNSKKIYLVNYYIISIHEIRFFQ